MVRGVRAGCGRGGGRLTRHLSLRLYLVWKGCKELQSAKWRRAALLPRASITTKAKNMICRKQRCTAVVAVGFVVGTSRAASVTVESGGAIKILPTGALNVGADAELRQELDETRAKLESVTALLNDTIGALTGAPCSDGNGCTVGDVLGLSATGALTCIPGASTACGGGIGPQSCVDSAGGGEGFECVCASGYTAAASGTVPASCFPTYSCAELTGLIPDGNGGCAQSNLALTQPVIAPGTFTYHGAGRAVNCVDGILPRGYGTTDPVVDVSVVIDLGHVVNTIGTVLVWQTSSAFAMEAVELFRCTSADGSSCVSVYASALSTNGVGSLGAALRPGRVDNVRYLKVATSDRASYYSGLGEVQVFAGSLPEMPHLVAVEQFDGVSVSLSWSFASASEAAAVTRLRIVRSTPCVVSTDGASVLWSYPDSPTTSPCGTLTAVYDIMRNDSGSVGQVAYLTDVGLSTGTYTYAAYALSATGWSPPSWRGVAVATMGEANPNLFLFRKATWVNRVGVVQTHYGLDSAMNDGDTTNRCGCTSSACRPANLHFDLKTAFTISRIVLFQPPDYNFAVSQAKLYVGVGGEQAEMPNSWTLLETSDLGDPATPSSNHTMANFGSQTARHWRLVLDQPNMYMGLAEVQAFAT